MFVFTILNFPRTIIGTFLVNMMVCNPNDKVGEIYNTDDPCVVLFSYPYLIQDMLYIRRKYASSVVVCNAFNLHRSHSTDEPRDLSS